MDKCPHEGLKMNKHVRTRRMDEITTVSLLAGDYLWHPIDHVTDLKGAPWRK